MRASAMSSVPAISRQRPRALAKVRPVMRGIVDGPRSGAVDISAENGFSSGKDRVGVDLDAPLGVEELFDGDHCRGGTDVGEDLAVRAADLLPVFGVGDVDA